MKDRPQAITFQMQVVRYGSGEAVKIVVVGICGALNSGDHAQLKSLISVLQEAFPSARIACVHRNPHLHGEIFPQCDWMEQIGTCHTFNMIRRRGANACRLLACLCRLPKALPVRQQITYHALREADLVVACPGGYLEDSGPHIFTNLVHLTLPIRNRCTWFIAPQSIGPFRHKWLMQYTSKILQRAAAICVREPLALTYAVEKMHLRSDRVHLFPDIAFFERDANFAGADNVLHSLGIGSNEPLAGLTLWPVGSRGGSENDYFRCLSNVAEHLYETHGLRTIILRQAGDAEGVKGDEGLLRRAAPFFGRAGIFSYEYHSPEVLRGIIGRCKVFYGTRMHGNIFALGQLVPTVAIAYHFKTEGIMRMCGQEKYVIHLEELEAGKLFQLIELAISNSGDIRRELSGVLREFDTKREELISLLRNSCNGL